MPLSNTNVNRASNVSAKNDSYPLQPSVKCKTNRTDKPNLLIVGIIQLDGIIIHGGTNDTTHNKLHTTQPHDLASKIIDIGNVCKSFGITKIAISSILPRKDQECQKCIDETNNYLKDFCGFYGFSFIDNSNIAEHFLHHDELHLNKVSSFLLGQNFVKNFNEYF